MHGVDFYLLLETLIDFQLQLTITFDNHSVVQTFMHCTTSIQLGLNLTFNACLSADPYCVHKVAHSTQRNQQSIL